MKTKLLLLLAAFTVAVTACQKENNDDTGNGGTDTTDYQPTTAGSTWQYNSTSSGTYTETALTGDTTIEGEKYTRFDNTDNGRVYISKSGTVYKTYSYVQEIDKSLTLTYLKDASAGTAWEDVVNFDYNGVPIPITFKYSIASRDADMTVNSTAYKNTIAVDTKIVANPLLVGGDGTIATGKRFYAKGVGLISSQLNFDALGTTISDSTYLVSADIK